LPLKSPAANVFAPDTTEKVYCTAQIRFVAGISKKGELYVYPTTDSMARHCHYCTMRAVHGDY